MVVLLLVFVKKNVHSKGKKDLHACIYKQTSIHINEDIKRNVCKHLYKHTYLMYTHIHMCSQHTKLKINTDAHINLHIHMCMYVG